MWLRVVQGVGVRVDGSGQRPQPSPTETEWGASGPRGPWLTQRLSAFREDRGSMLGVHTSFQRGTAGPLLRSVGQASHPTHQRKIPSFLWWREGRGVPSYQPEAPAPSLTARESRLPSQLKGPGPPPGKKRILLQKRSGSSDLPAFHSPFPAAIALEPCGCYVIPFYRGRN